MICAYSAILLSVGHWIWALGSSACGLQNIKGKIDVAATVVRIKANI